MTPTSFQLGYLAGCCYFQIIFNWVWVILPMLLYSSSRWDVDLSLGSWLGCFGGLLAASGTRGSALAGPGWTAGLSSLEIAGPSSSETGRCFALLRSSLNKWKSTQRRHRSSWFWRCHQMCRRNTCPGRFPWRSLGLGQWLCRCRSCVPAGQEVPALCTRWCHCW